MAKKTIKPSVVTGAVRHMMFYNQGKPAPWKLTQQLDHTWFLTVFGEKEIKRPFDANEFMDFVHNNYDSGAEFEMGDYGVASNCSPTLYFTEKDRGQKFLDDFTQILEKLI